MSVQLHFAGLPPFPWPEHSVSCFESPAQQCRECNDLLGPYPVTQWPKIWQLHQWAKKGIAAPLPENFQQRLAVSLASNPTLFAPIIRSLFNHEGE